MREYFKKEIKIKDFESAIQLAKRLKSSAETVKDLSMPLLADPEKLYEPAQFEKLLKEEKSTIQFRLWMQGRQLLIAMNAPKQEQAAKTIAEKLRTGLKSALYVVPKDEYEQATTYAYWALGYLQAYYALHDTDAYDKTKESLEAAVYYQHTHYSHLAKTGEEEEFFPKVMWTYAMAIQAAAWRGDEDSYQAYMRGLAILSNKSTPEASIAAMPKDWSPAWLASIVYSSALLMQKKSQAEAIQPELVKARQRTKDDSDKMLSFTTEHDYQELAKARAKDQAVEEVAEEAESFSMR